MFSQIKTPVCLVAVSVLAGGLVLAEEALAELKTEKEKVSYSIGQQIGSNFKRNEMDIDTASLKQGVEDALKGKKPALSGEEQQKVMTAFQSQMEKKMEDKQKVSADKNVKEGKSFLEANAKKPGVVVLPSGLQYKVVKEGTGAIPKASDTVTTHYRGTLIDGKEFDSSYSRGQPASFPVNGVIKGWTEALQLMKTGSKWQLFIPSELAYGARGAGPDIGPNSTLIFDIELLSIGKK